MKLRKDFLAALGHYAECLYNPEKPHLFVYTDKSGHQTPWTLEQTCSLALDTLEQEELYQLKFKALTDGLRQYGLHDLYKKIMHEDL